MKLLVIPSATLVPKEMRGNVGDIPTALYPLNGKTMLEHLLETYKGEVDKVCVVAYKNSYLLEDYIRWKHLNVDIVFCDELRDIGYTVLCGLKRYNDVESVIINFADTLVEVDDSVRMNNVIVSSNSKLNEEWTYFEEEKGVVTQLYDKDISDIPKMDNVEIFTGVFQLDDAKKFRKLLENGNDNELLDRLYSAIVNYSKENPFKIVVAKQWFDVGHAENFLKAKTGVEARAFNSIEIDDERGILKKTSKNVHKFIGEINWYVKMPSQLQYLVPRIYNYSLDYNDAYVEMEYYGYNTLHEMFMFADLPLVKWQEIFRKIVFMLNDMKKYTVQDDLSLMKEALYDIYIKKTQERMDELRKDSNFTIFFENNIIVNGKKFPSLDRVLKNFYEICQSKLIDTFDGEFCIIHGDLCLANILIEESHSFFRIIDPRGEFGKYDIYGDQRYEIAKLMHSVEGNYDYIIEDMFEIEVDGTEIKMDMPTKTSDICRVFEETFKNYTRSMDEARLIEASLFLSMIPLHNDHLNRQYAMLATGLLLLDRVVEELN